MIRVDPQIRCYYTPSLLSSGDLYLAELTDPSDKSLEIKVIRMGTQQCFRVPAREDAIVIFLPLFNGEMSSC